MPDSKDLFNYLKSSGNLEESATQEQFDKDMANPSRRGELFKHMKNSGLLEDGANIQDFENIWKVTTSKSPKPQAAQPAQPTSKPGDTPPWEPEIFKDVREGFINPIIQRVGNMAGNVISVLPRFTPTGAQETFAGTYKEPEIATHLKKKAAAIPTGTPITYEDVKKSGYKAPEILKYVTKSTVPAIVDMAGVLAAPEVYFPAMIADRANDVAYAKAQNDGRTEPDPNDIVTGLAVGVGDAILMGAGFGGKVADVVKEKIGTEALKAGFRKYAAKVAIGGTELAATELTMAIQSGILDYVGEKYGTKAKMSFEESLNLAEGAALGVAPLGLIGGIAKGASAKATRGTYRGFEQARGEELTRKITKEAKVSPDVAAKGVEEVDKSPTGAYLKGDFKPELERAIKDAKETGEPRHWERVKLNGLGSMNKIFGEHGVDTEVIKPLHDALNKAFEGDAKDIFDGPAGGFDVLFHQKSVDPVKAEAVLRDENNRILDKIKKGYEENKDRLSASDRTKAEALIESGDVVKSISAEITGKKSVEDFHKEGILEAGDVMEPMKGMTESEKEAMKSQTGDEGIGGYGEKIVGDRAKALAKRIGVPESEAIRGLVKKPQVSAVSGLLGKADRDAVVNHYRRASESIPDYDSHYIGADLFNQGALNDFIFKHFKEKGLKGTELGLKVKEESDRLMRQNIAGVMSALKRAFPGADIDAVHHGGDELGVVIGRKNLSRGEISGVLDAQYDIFRKQISEFESKKYGEVEGRTLADIQKKGEEGTLKKGYGFYYGIEPIRGLTNESVFKGSDESIAKQKRNAQKHGRPNIEAGAESPDAGRAGQASRRDNQEAPRGAGQGERGATESVATEQPEVKTKEEQKNGEERNTGIGAQGNEEARASGEQAAGEAGAQGNAAEAKPSQAQAPKARSVKDIIKTQLSAIGKFTPEQADAGATFSSLLFNSQAKEMGISPEELYKRLPYRIEKGKVSNNGVLNQQPLPEKINIDGVDRHTTNSNGKPVATTEEGVRNFWKWFGDSKVVDEQGRPKVVYHGTSNYFESFDKKKIGTTYGNDKTGFFFTTNPKMAEGAAIDNEYATGKPLPFGGRNLMPVYLKAENPLKIKTDIDASNYYDEHQSEIIKKAKRGKHSSIIIEGGDGHENIVVFSPEQIKSSVGNEGTFDPSNPNILKQQARGGFDPQRLTSIITEKSDFSTVVHETSHFYLEALDKIVDMPEATKQQKADFQTLMNWFGVKDKAAWDKLSMEEKRPYHEQLAYNMELYLAEGKAPTPELKPVFERIKQWLLDAYKNIKEEVNKAYRRETGKDLPIMTGEVREVIDRWMTGYEKAPELSEKGEAKERRFTKRFIEQNPELGKFASDDAKYYKVYKMGGKSVAEIKSQLNPLSIADLVMDEKSNIDSRLRLELGVDFVNSADAKYKAFKDTKPELAGEFRDMGMQVHQYIAQQFTLAGQQINIAKMLNGNTPSGIVNDFVAKYPNLKKADIDELYNKASIMFDETDKQTEFGHSVAYWKAYDALQRKMMELTPSPRRKILMGTIGRGNMLMSIKSPITNILGNAVQAAPEVIARRVQSVMQGGTANGLNSDFARQYWIHNWDVYQKSGLDPSRMIEMGDPTKTLGEKQTHSEGKGITRKIARFYETVIFKQMMGAPDVAFAAAHFADTANILSTSIAKKSGLKGQAAKAKALEIFKDAVLIEPVTPEGKMVRARAQYDAMRATFTDNSALSKAALKLRNIVDEHSGGLELGKLMVPFVKTPANVVMRGIEASGARVPYDAYQLIKGKKTGNEELIYKSIRGLTMAGLGMAGTYLLSSIIDPDEYIPEYFYATPSERALIKTQGASYNSVKIGNKYISLDYFGEFGAALAGWMYARKRMKAEGNLVDLPLTYTAAVAVSALRTPGIDEFGSAVGDLPETLKKTLKGQESPSGKLQTYAENELVDFAAARMIPAITGDIANALDEYERQGTEHKTLKGAIEKSVVSRVPGLRNDLPVKVDMFGESIKGQSPFAELAFGARYREGRQNDLINELSRLNAGSELPSVTDIRASNKKVQYMKDKIGTEQFNQMISDFSNEWGSAMREMISEEDYKEATDEEKKKMWENTKSEIIDEILEKYGYYELKDSEMTDK